ncbi:MAG: recombinase RecB [Planctomycetota bacterium]|nr:MAG: recombinase RecB [Planctomycetota bacterium]
MAYRPPRKYHPSALNLYRQCAFRFRCEHDEELRVPFADSEAAFVGRAAHLALRWFFDLAITPMPERRPEAMETLLRRAWARVPRPQAGDLPYDAAGRRALFGSAEQERAQGLATLAMLRSFLSSPEVDLAAVPIALEAWHEVRVGGRILAGRIDRIDRLSDTAIAVWDYKTGRLPSAHSVEELLAEDLQLSTYAAIAAKLYPFAETVRVGLLFLRHGRALAAEWDRARLEREQARVLEVAAAIEAEEQFAPRPNPLCPWCPYRPICPAREHTPAAPSPDAPAPEEVDW